MIFPKSIDGLEELLIDFALMDVICTQLTGMSWSCRAIPLRP